MSASHFISRAGQPLRATLHFLLDTSPTGEQSCIAQGTEQACIFQAVSCQYFCPMPVQAGTVSSPQNDWDALAVVRPVWDYTTMDSKPVAANQPDSTDGEIVRNEYLAPLHITWDGIAWHVSVLSRSPFHVTLPGNNTAPFSASDPACAAAADEIVSMGGYYAATGGIPAVDLRFEAGRERADGCLVVETPQQDQDAQFSPSFPAIFLLHRFGVILAANDAAHHYFPFLPLASTYEQKLAQHLAGLPAQ
jgi:hypothetical protein